MGNRIYCIFFLLVKYNVLLCLCKLMYVYRETKKTNINRINFRISTIYGQNNILTVLRLSSLTNSALISD